MKKLLALILFSVSLSLSAQDTTRYVVLSAGKPSGQQWVVRNASNSYTLFYEFNDRGRGPGLTVNFRTDDKGIPVYRTVSGFDYYKAPVEEKYELANGEARWKSATENGTKKVTAPSLYSPINSTPAEIEWMLQAALQQKNHQIETLPSGFLHVKHIKNHTTSLNGISEELELYSFVGAGGPPSHAWFTPKKKFFAAVSGWGGVVLKGYENTVTELYEAQKRAEHDYFELQADQLVEINDKPVAFKNVTVFNSLTGKYMKAQTVVVDKGLIREVGKASKVKIESNYKVIDGTGKVLMPGLWDNHAHYSSEQGLYHLAGGVTNIKDLGNALDLPDTKKQIDKGELLGPEISIMSGFIDFAGPFAGPTGKIVSTLEEGLAAVDFYADRGYQQVKLYSSIPVDWVKPLASRIHARGMKVCGHIPSFMTATRAVNDGYDQIIHMNMVMLNFMGDTLDTRSMGRFIKVGERAKDIDLKSASTKQFIQLLKSKNTVVDPTLAIFESMFVNDEGKLANGYESIVNQFPAEFKRSLYTGGLPTRKGKESIYRQSYDNMLKMLKLLYDSKITFVPGTDDFPGFALHRELELYAKAGVPNAHVLKSATLVSAQVAGKEKELGSVEVGKKANLILIDGDPLKNISDIRKVELVMKAGNIYHPKALYQSYGFGFWK